MESLSIKVQRLNEAAVLPSQKHSGDAGWDLYSLEDKTLGPGERYMFPLGIAVDFPAGHVALFRDRSSMGSKGIHTLAGVLDASYRGEWKLVLLNTTNEAYEVKKGDRIAQCLFLPIAMAELSEVASLDDTSRGAGGFGSTGN